MEVGWDVRLFRGSKAQATAGRSFIAPVSMTGRCPDAFDITLGLGSTLALCSRRHAPWFWHHDL